MPLWISLILLGMMLVFAGIVQQGWALPGIWFGANFMILAIAHLVGAHRVFGKRADGTLPVWSWFLYLPLFSYTIAVWHLIRLLSRESAQSAVTENLVIGRRLLPSELSDSYDNYVDLTAEFQEPSSIRQSKSYYNVPILDGAAPSPDVLRTAVSKLHSGRTFVHCAQGHGRTGLFALALLLTSKEVHTIEEGLQLLKSVRPDLHLNNAQLKCIQEYTRNQQA